MSKKRCLPNDLVDESSPNNEDIGTKEKEIDEKNERMKNLKRRCEAMPKTIVHFKKAEELKAKLQEQEFKDRLGKEGTELKLNWSRNEIAQNLEIEDLRNQCRELRKNLDEKAVSESELQVKVVNQKKEIKNLYKKIEIHDDFVAKLKNRIECPVCLGVPSDTPVYSCPNGHMICNRCKMDSCPTCKEVMGTGKSILAVTIIENIEHECRIDGCGETLGFEDLSKHMRECKHRMVRCPFADCDKTMPLMDLMKHLADSKMCCMFIKDGEETGSGFTQLFSVNNFFKDRVWKIGVFKHQGVNFALMTDQANGYMNMSLLMFKSEVRCAKYKLEMIVHSAESTPKDAKVSYISRGAPGSIDQFWDKSKQLRLSVGDESMRSILKRENNHDQFKVSINII